MLGARLEYKSGYETTLRHRVRKHSTVYAIRMTGNLGASSPFHPGITFTFTVSLAQKIVFTFRESYCMRLPRTLRMKILRRALHAPVAPTSFALPMRNCFRRPWSSVVCPDFVALLQQWLWHVGHCSSACNSFPEYAL